MQYVQDYDEVLPNRSYVTGDNWFDTPAPKIEVYTKNRQIFICPPKGVGSPDPLNATTPVTGATGEHNQSYGYNYLGVFSVDSNAHALADIKYMAQTIAITEKG